jgi:hypothetical protein
MIVSKSERVARLRVAKVNTRCRQAEKELLQVMADGDAAAEAVAVEKVRIAQQRLTHAEAIQIAVLERRWASSAANFPLQARHGPDEPEVPA